MKLQTKFFKKINHSIKSFTKTNQIHCLNKTCVLLFFFFNILSLITNAETLLVPTIQQDWTTYRQDCQNKKYTCLPEFFIQNRKEKKSEKFQMFFNQFDLEEPSFRSQVIKLSENLLAHDYLDVSQDEWIVAGLKKMASFDHKNTERLSKLEDLIETINQTKTWSSQSAEIKVIFIFKKEIPYSDKLKKQIESVGFSLKAEVIEHGYYPEPLRRAEKIDVYDSRRSLVNGPCERRSYLADLEDEVLNQKNSVNHENILIMTSDSNSCSLSSALSQSFQQSTSHASQHLKDNKKWYLIGLAALVAGYYLSSQYEFDF